MTVHQSDHFDVTHIPLICTAAPVFDPSGNLAAVLDIGHIPHVHGDAVYRLQNNIAYIRKAIISSSNQTFAAHDKLFLRSFDVPSAGIRVICLQCRFYVRNGQRITHEPIRVDIDLILSDRTAITQNVSHAWDRPQLELYDPIIDRSQLH